MEQKRKINAFPAKSFFIKTLVKDIDLRDAMIKQHFFCKFSFCLN